VIFWLEISIAGNHGNHKSGVTSMLPPHHLNLILMRMKQKKLWLIYIKDKDVAQPVWLSDCPIKGHFRAKKANLQCSDMTF
jgi:hypothetical protein